MPLTKYFNQVEQKAYKSLAYVPISSSLNLRVRTFASPHLRASPPLYPVAREGRDNVTVRAIDVVVCSSQATLGPPGYAHYS